MSTLPTRRCEGFAVRCGAPLTLGQTLCERCQHQAKIRAKLDELYEQEAKALLRPGQKEGERND